MGFWDLKTKRYYHGIECPHYKKSRYTNSEKPKYQFVLKWGTFNSSLRILVIQFSIGGTFTKIMLLIGFTVCFFL